MSSLSATLVPIATYLLKVVPGVPVSISDDDFPVTVRITMAAIDPEAVDDEKTPSTLRILKRPDAFPIGGLELGDSDSDDEDDDDEEDEDDDDEEEEDEDEEVKKPKKASKKQAEDEDEDEDEDEAMDSDEESDSDEEYEIDPIVLCTLSPSTSFQQPLDLVINGNEEVLFEVTGSYTISLSGNYVTHPFNDHDDYDDLDDSDEDEFDLSPDEDELIEGYSDSEEDELDDLEENPRVQALTEEEEAEIEKEAEDLLRAAAEEAAAEDKLVKSLSGQAKKVNGKRAADEDLDDLIEKESSKPEPKLTKKQLKKLKATDGSAAEAPAAAASKKNKESPKDKKVTFAKNLEQGPTGSGAPTPTKTATAESKTESAAAKPEPKVTKLEGGLTIEDRAVGEGAGAKNGQKVGVRYIGKLQNGKVFDSNTKGKPFTFVLGKGQVIKGWDLGVKGMATKGERRITVPPQLGYGKQAIPGIPANSTLIFDVKLVSLK
ncbi:uncharacterized protein V1516DRAFT_690547 [Lipomyces oligophaga]|uniref:uncharacterized protein n=1 Tax=Lipomyces oligophaga TaxID=45792 RepID=UPI0034CDC749